MKKLLTLLLLTLIATALPTAAQRRITPVKPSAAITSQKEDEEQKRRLEKSRLARRTDAEGNIIFVDTVSGEEWIDTTTVKTSTKNIYPLMESISVGVNIFDPVMRLFGQQYGGADIWTELSLHNRYKPIVEFGLGSADITPDGQNFTFRSPLAPYFRLGCSYNIFYNNTPDYQLSFGFRYGFSTFRYSIDDVTIGTGYWDDPAHISFPSQNATAGWLEITAALKVKIYKAFSMGWTLKFHSLLHESKNTYGKPMYIPGYGNRENILDVSLSLIYTFTLNKPDPELVNKDKKK